MLKGVFSVLPTPFIQDGSVDAPGLRRVIDLYLRAGVNGLTACGVTSETSRLTDEERILVMEMVMTHVRKRVPVIIGTSADGIHPCREFSKRAKQLGADAVMISPPRMSKLSSEAVVSHYRALADSVDVPIIVQDYPPATGFSMEASLLARIAREVPSVKGIKLEDPPTPLKIGSVLRQTKGLDLEIVGGLGGTYLIEELMAGGVGAMTGFAVPEILVRIVRAFHEGRLEEATDFFYGTVALMRFEFQEGVGMAIRKEILRRRGVIANAGTRGPGAQLDPLTSRALDSLLAWFQKQHQEIQWTLD